MTSAELARRLAMLEFFGREEPRKTEFEELTLPSLDSLY